MLSAGSLLDKINTKKVHLCTFLVFALFLNFAIFELCVESSDILEKGKLGQF